MLDADSPLPAPTALLFPGQGSQFVGMGRELLEASPIAREIFARADAALGFGLTDVCLEGPPARLVETEIAQPALLTHGVAAASVALAAGLVTADAAAGHSLGEWTAHVVAGTMELETAVRLVHLRGRLMQMAVPVGQGAMASIVGLDEEAVRAACEHASVSGTVSPATFNGGGNIAIAGTAAAVAAAGARALELGALQVIPLEVSAPFHCALMAPVCDALAEALAAAEVRLPGVPVSSNVDAGFADSADEVRRQLVRQVVAPVRWDACLGALAAAGTERFVVLGAGNSLARMVKRLRIGPTVEFLSDAALASAVAGGE